MARTRSSIVVLGLALAALVLACGVAPALGKPARQSKQVPTTGGMPKLREDASAAEPARDAETRFDASAVDAAEPPKPVLSECEKGCESLMPAHEWLNAQCDPFRQLMPAPKMVSTCRVGFAASVVQQACKLGCQSRDVCLSEGKVCVLPAMLAHEQSVCGKYRRMLPMPGLFHMCNLGFLGAAAQGCAASLTLQGHDGSWDDHNATVTLVHGRALTDVTTPVMGMLRQQLEELDMFLKTPAGNTVLVPPSPAAAAPATPMPTRGDAPQSTGAAVDGGSDGNAVPAPLPQASQPALDAVPEPLPTTTHAASVVPPPQPPTSADTFQPEPPAGAVPETPVDVPAATAASGVVDEQHNAAAAADVVPPPEPVPVQEHQQHQPADVSNDAVPPAAADAQSGDSFADAQAAAASDAAAAWHSEPTPSEPVAVTPATPSETVTAIPDPALLQQEQLLQQQQQEQERLYQEQLLQQRKQQEQEQEQEQERLYQEQLLQQQQQQEQERLYQEQLLQQQKQQEQERLYQEQLLQQQQLQEQHQQSAPEVVAPVETLQHQQEQQHADAAPVPPPTPAADAAPSSSTIEQQQQQQQHPATGEAPASANNSGDEQAAQTAHRKRAPRRRRLNLDA